MTAPLTAYKLRRCMSMHHCRVCGMDITLGQFYHDGGYGRRAHKECAEGRALLVNWDATALILPCGSCKEPVPFDYAVDDAFWQLYSGKDRLGVLCLPCLARLSAAQGGDVTKALRVIYFSCDKGTVPFIKAKGGTTDE